MKEVNNNRTILINKLIRLFVVFLVFLSLFIFLANYLISLDRKTKITLNLFMFYPSIFLLPLIAFIHIIDRYKSLKYDKYILWGGLYGLLFMIYFIVKLVIININRPPLEVPFY